ncbi:MAG: transcription antitermination factor NusB [Candidatus Marinimicrobia bacterium]|nr:transcription antitermination factor NusB [Candidatus Neomarinimicrobiota bacterium]
MPKARIPEEDNPNMKSDRRKSRELALQTIYAYNMQIEGEELEKVSINEIKKNLIFGLNVKKSVAEYAEKIVDITLANKKKINNQIIKTSDNWDIDRISHVDKALLYIAIAEMLNCPDVPVKVVINEALELARSYSSDESIPFINGILDGIHKKWGKKVRRIEEPSNK